MNISIVTKSFMNKDIYTYKKNLKKMFTNKQKNIKLTSAYILKTRYYRTMWGKKEQHTLTHTKSAIIRLSL